MHPVSGRNRNQLGIQSRGPLEGCESAAPPVCEYVASIGQKIQEHAHKEHVEIAAQQVKGAAARRSTVEHVRDARMIP